MQRWGNFLVATSMLISSSVHAQIPDPRKSLANIIEAFQNCGPTQAYQALSPYLFQAIGNQTGGTGCYQQIAAAGPVTKTEIIETQTFPLGPLYIIRVTHSTGIRADWFIGFNVTTGKIEHLTFQPVVGSDRPKIENGPSSESEIGNVDANDNPTNKPNDEQKPTGDPKSSDSRKDEMKEEPKSPPRPSIEELCKKFPSMCP